MLKTVNIYTYKGYVLNTVNSYTYKGYEGYLGSAGDMHVYIRTVTNDCMLKTVEILYLKTVKFYTCKSCERHLLWKARPVARIY